MPHLKVVKQAIWALWIPGFPFNKLVTSHQSKSNKRALIGDRPFATYLMGDCPVIMCKSWVCMIWFDLMVGHSFELP